MVIPITNYYYAVKGKKFWFANITEAINNLRIIHPQIYANCVSPHAYIQKVIIYLPETMENKI